tara:strand:- start:465 stop:1700 length:1236 start_codon:yes stop_codon:yes gene_type:complete
MATFKGENSTISLKAETEFAKPLADYSGAKVFQNNSGSFQSSRNSLESEARTPNAQLSGQRLGNRSVTASFPLEVDAVNYGQIFESCLYSDLVTEGAAVDVTSQPLTALAKHSYTVVLTAGEQTTLALREGMMFLVSAVSTSVADSTNGYVVVTNVVGTTVTFFAPQQTQDNFAAISSDLTITPVAQMRPAKTRTSFNAEETLTAEDGTTTARFMTTGAVVSGVALELPSEGLITATPSFVASNYIASSDYEDFDTNLTNSAAAHTSVTAHSTQEPMVLQDGVIISDTDDIRCQWVSGNITIENGTETFYTGCKYEANGAISGELRVSLSYEALFQSEEDFRSFESETTSKVLLQMKDRSSGKSILMYLPKMKRTEYTLTNDKGLVTASVTGTALIDDGVGDSLVLAIQDS